MSESETRHSNKKNIHVAARPQGSCQSVAAATLMETAPGVSVADVIANTEAEAELVIPAEVPEMAISA